MKTICHYISALFLLLLTACASEPAAYTDGLGKEVDTTLTVTTDETTAEADDNELINSWWVAFVAPDGKVQAIVERNLGKSPVEEDFAKVKVPTGNYLLVAFANRIPALGADGETYELSNGEETLKFKKGAASPVTSSTDARLWNDSAPENWAAGELVPMSGLQSVSVTGRTGEQLNVEVVRQVARIELSFENIGKRDLRVNSYRIVKFKSNKVTLFPDYDQLGSTPTLPSEAKAQDVVRNVDLDIETGKKGYDTFYSRESMAELPTGVYTLVVNVTHREGMGWHETTDEMSALLTDISYVNRNDLIRIPVKLTDYIINLEALFYPPIGGYPAVMTDAGAGNYYVRFGSMGVFTIRPHVRKAVALGDPDFGEMTNAYLNMQILKIEGDPIFIQEPELDVNHDIIGQLGAEKGQAKVTLGFTIPQADGSAISYVRTILIIRD